MRLVAAFCVLTVVGATFAGGAATAAGENRTATASKTTGIDPDGEPVTITGEGFDPNKGIYIALCVDNGSGQLSSPCLGGVDMSGENGSSAWISSNPPSYGEGLATPYGPNGSFSVTLQVAAADEFVDCRDAAAAPDGCVIYMRTDHTRTSDRSQDFRIPVSFASESGSGGGDDRTSDDNDDNNDDTTGGSGGQNNDDGLARTGVAVIGVGVVAAVLIAGGTVTVLVSTRRGSGRKLTAMSAAGVISAALLVGPSTGPAEAAPLDITSGTLTWGVKESLRTHVLSPVAGGEVTTAGDATVLDAGTIEFEAAVDHGAYDPDALTGTLAFGGSVRLAAHDQGGGPLLDLTIADPRLVIDDGDATLIADITGNGNDSRGDDVAAAPERAVQYDDVALIDIDVSDESISPGRDGVVHVDGAATTLTEDGAEALAGYYEAGTALDPVSFTIQLAGVLAHGVASPTSSEAPALAVSVPGGDLQRGSDVVVSGSGYLPGRAVFVAVTPDGDAVGRNPSPFAHSKRVVVGADGTFTTTLEDVRPVFTNEDTSVDCSETRCHVASFSSPLRIDNQASARSADRSQDVFVPVTFSP